MPAIDINSLSLEQKIGQLFFIGIPGPELDESTQQLIDKIQPGGICLFARNIKGLSQTRALLEGLHSAISVPPFLSLDQEGGRVDRLRRVTTPMPAASQLRNAEDARELGSIIGETLSLLGFNMDFAPVVDVIDEARGGLVNGLQSRGLGTSKEHVVEMAAAFLRSLEQHDILGCLKHFPGLAAAQVDSHEELPVVQITHDELNKVDLYPYRELIHSFPCASVMIAHAAYPNTRLQEFDDNGKLLPSSLSSRVVKTLLRDELNFKGVAITDDMEMGAIVRNYGIGEACKMAVNAGADMLAICASVDAIYDGYHAVTSAVREGSISEECLDASVTRILDLKAAIPEPRGFDADKFEELNQRIVNLNNNLN
ncbi:MAG: glycoside hydrolase family 3 N-terminal domain-containing protein [bacterium]|nr:glycoside hydrolase family 3 N-terminal domain-containing protein [bacterium]